MAEEKKYKSQCMKQYLAIRKAKGLTAKDMSEMTGICITSLRSYETGRRSPPLAKMELLVRAVGGKGIGIEGWA